MESTKKKIQTLHAHTTNSDGTLTYAQVLKTCAENNIGVVAFTDHDNLPTEDQFFSLKKQQDQPTKYIWGIELTSGYPKEIAEKEPNLFHIVGLFVNPLDTKLVNFVAEQKRVRNERMKMRIKSFAEIGFEIKSNDVFSQLEKGGAPSALNLVKALMVKSKNNDLADKYFSKLKKVSGTDAKVKILYEKTIKDARPGQKYFNLFLNDDSPFKVSLPERERVPMDTIVSVIRKAGGVAVMAHWTFERKNVTRQLVEKLAEEKRIDGVETVYDLFLLNDSFWKRKIQLDRVFLRKIAKTCSLFTSGGVDAHKKEDFKLFADTKSYSRETVGMVQKIIASTNCDVKNSSLVRGVDF